MSEKPDPTPAELRVREGGRVLRVTFAGGMRRHRGRPAARGEPERRQAPPRPGGVRIVDVEPIGNYAARFAFSDGHDTGIYSLDAVARADRRV